MLCSRSASLMTSTRMSLDIATIILRIVSDCAESPYCTLSSFVTPSTSWATSLPKSFVTCSRTYGVSSTVSWRRAATSVASVMPSSARIVVTALAQLTLVQPLRGDVGTLEQRQVGLRVVRTYGAEQRLEHGVADGAPL